MIQTLTPTITGIRTFRGIPAQGMRYLSVNLARVDIGELSEIAKALDFKIELVQMPMKEDSQLHALLWHGAIASAPADLDDRYDALCDRIDPGAVRYASGQTQAEFNVA
jgi:hypothetical protein